MPTLRQVSLTLVAVIVACLSLTSCRSDSPVSTALNEPDRNTAERDTTETPGSNRDVQPEPFVPSGPVGSRTAYDELVAQLDAALPPELRAQVPWPDLRDPDPVAAQLAIFDLWIWMAANHPEPELAPIMTVADSPSRTEVVSIFGELDSRNHLQAWEQQPYRAFDHRVVTLESAGLPLWVTRDAPTDAVVVYYQDEAGPLTIRDRDTNEVLATDDPVEARQWLSIIAPTEVGWQLYRDILIDPSNAELTVPETFAPPVNADRNRVQP